jgi:hypothetical protein
MEDREYKDTELFLDTLLRAGIVFLSAFLVMVLLGGCSADKDRSRAIDLAVKGSYIPGSTAGTRNQIPQGGTDEKSGSTPTSSTD